MVVSVVIKLQTESFKSPVEAFEFYLDRLEKAGAKSTRSVEVEMMSYRTHKDLPNPKSFHILTHSEYPASSFAFVEQSTCPMLVADETFVRLINQLKSLRAFVTNQSNMIARGSRLEYKDFIINLSTVTQSETAKGVLLEVAYPLTNEIFGGYVVIQELLQSFLNVSKQDLYRLLPDRLNLWIQTAKEKRKTPDDASSMTILQYLELLNHMRNKPNE